MIIHPPEIERKGNKIRVSAYIEVETRKERSDTLWYEFDAGYEEFVSHSLNGFISAMLFLAMNMGEDIDAKGFMSPRLAYGLKEFQRYFHFWYPEEFKVIEIGCSGFEVEKSAAQANMCTFSGGVDSFYTLYEHLPEKEGNPLHQLTHCLLLDGFAAPRTSRLNESYRVIRESYEALLGAYGVTLVVVATNLSDFYQGILNPVQIDGPVLASTPMILGRLISTFHIASCLSYSQILPRGSNAITNTLLSTENLTVTIHGSEQSRVEKTRAIAEWPATYEHLRVCWEEFGVKNCCRCEKCVRTMITLKVAGVLSDYKTFPIPLTRKMVRTWPLFEKHNHWFASEIVDFAKSRGRGEMVGDVRYAMVRSKVLNAIFWAPSAALKKKSKTYNKLVKKLRS